MLTSKTVYFDADSSSPVSTGTMATINYKTSLDEGDLVPLQIVQGDESVWLGKEQAKALYQLLHEELNEGGLLA